MQALPRHERTNFVAKAFCPFARSTIGELAITSTTPIEAVWATLAKLRVNPIVEEKSVWVTVKRTPAQRQKYNKVKDAYQAVIELLGKLGVAEEEIKKQVEICPRSSRVYIDESVVFRLTPSNEGEWVQEELSRAHAGLKRPALEDIVARRAEERQRL